MVGVLVEEALKPLFVLLSLCVLRIVFLQDLVPGWEAAVDGVPEEWNQGGVPFLIDLDALQEVDGQEVGSDEEEDLRW